jgi:hypothetical protein
MILPINASKEEQTAYVEKWCRDNPDKVKKIPLSEGQLDLVVMSWFKTYKQKQRRYRGRNKNT